LKFASYGYNLLWGYDLYSTMAERLGSDKSFSTPDVQHLPKGGGAEDLAIRFVNTKAWRLRDVAEERIGSPDALFEWLDRNVTLLPSGVRQRRYRKEAAGWYAAAIRLRESIYDILTCRMLSIEPPSASLAYFNECLSEPGAGSLIRFETGTLGWTFAKPTSGALLRPIVLSAAELMTGVRASKVRRCQDDRGCGWLFVDESRLQNRRWCSMGDCGNRAKAHRHYDRTKRAARNEVD
jgi:predicted RNA-binding Zn ribbon-like protein